MIDLAFNPNSAKTVIEKINEPERRKLTAKESLSLMIEGNLTKKTYELMRKVSLEHGHDLYPSYKKVKNFYLLFY